MNSNLSTYRLIRPRLAPQHWGGVAGTIGILFTVLVLVFMPDSEWLWTMRAFYAFGLLLLSITLAVVGEFVLRFLWYQRQKMRHYEGLFSVARHSEERRNQIETVLKYSTVWIATFSPVCVLYSRGKFYVKFQRTEGASIENDQMLLLCDETDLYPFGWFLVVKIDQEEFLAVECTNIDPLWRGNMLRSSKSELDPPPRTLGFAIRKEAYEYVRHN